MTGCAAPSNMPNFPGVFQVSVLDSNEAAQACLMDSALE